MFVQTLKMKLFPYHWLINLRCWEYKDVAFFKLNAREEYKKSTLTPGAIERLRISLKSDYTLYDHFR